MCIFTELTSLLTIFVHLDVSKKEEIAKYNKNMKRFDKKYTWGSIDYGAESPFVSHQTVNISQHGEKKRTGSPF